MQQPRGAEEPIPISGHNSQSSSLEFLVPLLDHLGKLGKGGQQPRLRGVGSGEDPASPRQQAQQAKALRINSMPTRQSELYENCRLMVSMMSV